MELTYTSWTSENVLGAPATAILGNKLSPKSQWFAANIDFALTGLQVPWEPLVQAMSWFGLAPYVFHSTVQVKAVAVRV